MKIIFNLFIRWVGLNYRSGNGQKKCVVVSASMLQKQSDFNVFLKLWLNLCSVRCLKPNISLVNIFVPNELLIFKIFFQQVL